MSAPPTWAEMQAYGLRQCAWCMEIRDMTVLDEVVIREARTGRTTAGLFEDEGAARTGRSVCWRCRDTLACSAAAIARSANDAYQFKGGRG